MDSQTQPPPVDENAQSQPVPDPAPSPVPPASSPTPPVQPKLGSAVLFFVLVVAVVAGAGGYVLGLNGSKKPVKTEVPTPTPVKQAKVANKITGSIKTDTHEFDYLIVDVSQYGKVKAVNHESRFVVNPQSGVDYSYSFDALAPDISYAVRVQGCAENGRVTTCVLADKITNCSGRIPDGQVQLCLIDGDGNADFFVDKNLLYSVGRMPEGVTPLPTPTTQPPTPTPTQ